MGSSAISESKSFASLGPMLLARKGTAKPAMRAQLEQSDRMAMLEDDFDALAESQDALGWNDMGDAFADNDQVVPLPVANRRSKAAKRADKAVKAKDKAAFTLRLDAERHMKLRLASTLAGSSAQQLVTQALDAFLAKNPELEAIAEQMAKNSKTS
ncbi:hypothetical protein [Aurantiacibacter aquimixticola]|uniref:Uncharacterized protein n=1 Tax=Aurantiacibacter aquimixticola TaxID=1958945 RepID=A0A419RTK8_9SPHN|nr:hypothetical protein [Aurantiacibacter aquimixticola]RJY09116.1 hypothetical protein D6201_06850 [Aurantiacibacter aquimixticola]